MCRLSLCWCSVFCKQNFVVFVFGGFHLFVDGCITFSWFWIYHIIHLELVVLSNFMARIPDKINSIDGSKEALKLVVRITDLWFVGTPNKSKQAKMVIVLKFFLYDYVKLFEGFYSPWIEKYFCIICLCFE